MDKNIVISAWLYSGLFDLFAGFCQERYFLNKHRVFFTILGLEKICKSYVLYTEASEYVDLGEMEAKKRIDEIAKKYQHNFDKMFRDKITPNIGDPIKNILIKGRYFKIGDKCSGFTGEKLLKTARKAYEECRYPTPKPISNEFPINEYFNIDPINASEFLDFIYNLCREIIKDLRRKVDLCPRIHKMEEFYGGVDEWRRFKNIFFKETDGNIFCFFGC